MIISENVREPVSPTGRSVNSRMEGLKGLCMDRRCSKNQVGGTPDGGDIKTQRSRVGKC